MKLKYIVFDDALPVLFGEYFKHTDIVVKTEAEPTSAGFCTIKKEIVLQDGVEAEHIKVDCFGESSSLNLKHRPQDCKVIENLFNPRPTRNSNNIPART